jgi:hypothetical protein
VKRLKRVKKEPLSDSDREAIVDCTSRPQYVKQQQHQKRQLSKPEPQEATAAYEEGGETEAEEMAVAAAKEEGEETEADEMAVLAAKEEGEETEAEETAIAMPSDVFE